MLLALVLQNITFSSDLQILGLYLFGAHSLTCAERTIPSLLSPSPFCWLQRQVWLFGGLHVWEEIFKHSDPV